MSAASPSPADVCTAKTPCPLLSVVVVCKNPGARLAAALESVWAQTHRPEVIVIDGNSTDGTAAWLETKRNRMGAFVSEPDRGVYDAMNKGLSLATGEWILFLGADDRLASPLVVAEAAACLPATNACVVVGEVAYDDGRIYRLQPKANPLARNFVHHQGTFYRRSLFAQLGGFETALTVMGDYEFNLRLWKTGVQFRPLKLRVAECASRGLSDAGRWQGYREEIAVRHRYAGFPRCWLWDAASVIRFLRKRLLLSRRRPHG